MDDPLAHLLDAGLELSRDQRYRAERELGRGAMGAVYAGRDLLLDRPVAIKVMAGTLADATLRRCFEREARAAARLSHRNVVTVHDSGCDARGTPFVVMELLRGHDLRRALAGGRPIPIDRRLAIVLQVLAGLAHAHASGVVHRDVKPANVFLTEDGVVKLLDFGLARLNRTSATRSSDAVVGTADYMSPEQVLGGGVDARGDLFSCGALLFELLAGRPPFHAESFVSIAYRVVHEEPAYAALPASCRALEPVLRRALAKSPDDRYGSAPDFATDIGLAMGVGVAPETIQPAPAWTMPLPRLPRRTPAPTAERRQWEEDALRPPDHSPVLPRWPLPGALEEEEPVVSPVRGRTARVVLGMAAGLAAAAIAVGGAGIARREAASAGVPAATAAGAPVVAPAGAAPAPALPPTERVLQPAPDLPAAPVSRRDGASRRPRRVPGGSPPFWTVVGRRPGTPAAAAPSPAASSSTTRR